MQEAIIDRIETTRKQIRDWRTDQLGGLQERQRTLLKHGENALNSGKTALINLEANTLESARDLLAWASESLGPRASFLARGRDALDEALVALKAGHSATLPIEDFDQLSIARVLPQLDGLSAAELRTLSHYETEHKNRKTLLAELDARIGATTEVEDA
ncbi:MAG: hypothetical protein CMP23_16325 [Rickettsiales bacterium]|nr:hypothetical protein [Rickettsiales bacterium]|tara:strand:+ start:2568 stop:3044 length:477 start_codon:yes stop_codon:yes gene_type:complete